MGADLLVTCQPKMAEKAWVFFTPLLRRNLFQAAAAFITAIIHGESKQNGTGDWIWEMLCSCMWREWLQHSWEQWGGESFPEQRGSWWMKPWLTAGLWRRRLALPKHPRIALFTKPPNNWNISSTIESQGDETVLQLLRWFSWICRGLSIGNLIPSSRNSSSSYESGLMLSRRQLGHW